MGIVFPSFCRSRILCGSRFGTTPHDAFIRLSWRFHDTSTLHLDQRARWATGRVSSHVRANTADADMPHHQMGASAGMHLPAESPLLKELEDIARWACSLGNALIVD